MNKTKATIEMLGRVAALADFHAASIEKFIPQTPYLRESAAAARADASCARQLRMTLCDHPNEHYNPPMIDEGVAVLANCELCKKVWPAGQRREKSEAA